MLESWRALRVAIGYLSQAAALFAGAVFATWCFNAALVLWMVYAVRVWNDRRISLATLEIDLIVIALGVVTNRQTGAILSELLRQSKENAAQAKAVLTALVAIERRLGRIEALGGLSPERHPNRGRT